jgi:hypothetical protein
MLPTDTTAQSSLKAENNKGFIAFMVVVKVLDTIECTRGDRQ